MCSDVIIEKCPVLVDKKRQIGINLMKTEGHDLEYKPKKETQRSVSFCEIRFSTRQPQIFQVKYQLLLVVCFFTNLTLSEIFLLSIRTFSIDWNYQREKIFFF